MNLYYYAVYLFIIFTFNVTPTKSTSGSSGSCAGSGYPTGSVLFHNKKCWLHEDLVLLSARKTMQNLIPTNTLNVNNDGFILVLIDYFRMCFSVIQKMSCGRSQDILLLALADAIGGYLHYYVIPVTKQSFYCGNVRYDYARKLFNFYDEIKVHLDTSGKRWTKPIDTSKMDLKTRALTITPCSKEVDPCAQLLINDKRSGDAADCKTAKSSPIPIPYMDDAEAPSSIAVPFRSSSLRKLCSAGAAFILEKYYVAGTQCLMSKDGSKDDLSLFNSNLHKWLLQTVMPRLSDEQWYPAFGGVRKIIKTMRSCGVDSGSADASSEGKMIDQQSRGMDSDVAHQDDVEPSEGNQSSIITWSLLMAAGFGVLTAWICGALLCLCVRCHMRRKENKACKDLNTAGDDDSYHFINTFVQIFYDMKDCGKKCEQADSKESAHPKRPSFFSKCKSPNSSKHQLDNSEFSEPETPRKQSIFSRNKSTTLSKQQIEDLESTHQIDNSEPYDPELSRKHSLFSKNKPTALSKQQIEDLESTHQGDDSEPYEPEPPRKHSIFSRNKPTGLSKQQLEDLESAQRRSSVIPRSRAYSAEPPEDEPKLGERRSSVSRNRLNSTRQDEPPEFVERRSSVTSRNRFNSTRPMPDDDVDLSSEYEDSPLLRNRRVSIQSKNPIVQHVQTKASVQSKPSNNSQRRHYTKMEKTKSAPLPTTKKSLNSSSLVNSGNSFHSKDTTDSEITDTDYTCTEISSEEGQHNIGNSSR